MKIRNNGPPVDTAAMLVVKDDLHDIGFQRDLIRRLVYRYSLGRRAPRSKTRRNIKDKS